MFRTIACWVDDKKTPIDYKLYEERATELFTQYPLFLTEELELAWEYAFLGSVKRSNLPGISDDILLHFLHNTRMPGLIREYITMRLENRDSDDYPLLWRHLIYAYMIENTGIYEIFRRVVYEYVYGEKLGVPEPDAQQWLRNTEELFYRDPPPFHILSITSHIRPDVAATRRNAYWRMFGMSLNHGNDNSKPSYYPYVPYVKAEVANTEFVTRFEEFLREVWVGIQNYNNKSGTNPTDNARIADLAKTLHEMLTTRRQHGNLSREEFVFVSMMEWFHMTVEFNSPIVETLRADASDPAQRLFKIAERVGVPAHKDARSYFALADPMAWVLLFIETGKLNDAAAVPILYTPPTYGGLSDKMETIINHWSIISRTGGDIKARPVTAR